MILPLILYRLACMKYIKSIKDFEREVQMMTEEKNVKGEAAARNTENTESKKAQDPAENCDSNCNSCASDCASRKPGPPAKEPLHMLSRVERVIGIVSGKGGVGKSLVTSMMAVAMNRKGYRTAVLDADITGPSIPRMFGIEDGAKSTGMGLSPAKTAKGTEIMSLNLLLENKEDAVIWRGSMVAGVIKQFWRDVIWSNIDYMFVDMPPGTGDVPLTVYQSLPIDGIIIVATPQELVSMIVAKAVNMANHLNVPILGLVENMSYLECPDCSKQIKLFGESHVEEIADKYKVKLLSKIPLNPEIAAMCDAGKIEEYNFNWLDETAQSLEEVLPIRDSLQ